MFRTLDENTPIGYSRLLNKRGKGGGGLNKLVGLKNFSYQYERFSKVRLGVGW